ncbi:hypothetical protein CDAR_394361 [Caerostris darwini]|uniref:Uncharacterized protein n=1 Tax=Caerostris darwini TaxID=1538125 RepID=A0AAV4RIR8_9ARAC|nr:hypothetical protein CDAR_394361 [Caerostris darwini]
MHTFKKPLLIRENLESISTYINHLPSPSFHSNPLQAKERKSPSFARNPDKTGPKPFAGQRNPAARTPLKDRNALPDNDIYLVLYTYPSIFGCVYSMCLWTGDYT